MRLRDIVIIATLICTFALSTQVIDKDQYGFQPEPEVRHLLK